MTSLDDDSGPVGEFGSAPVARNAEPDAHGQAALLLSESILHALVESSVLSQAEALAAVRTACEVKIEMAVLTDESSGRMHQSLALLNRIAQTLEADAD